MPDEPTWNEIPFSEDAPAEVKAAEFEAQYAENQASGDAKNESGEWRG